MADTDETVGHSNRFIKGVKRAFFTPIKPKDTPAPSQSPDRSVRVRSVIGATFKEQTPSTPATPPSPRRKRTMKPFIVIILIFILGGLAFYSFRMYFQAREQLESFQLTGAPIGEQQAKDIIARVKRHMVLPEGTPLITTITDVAPLRSQPFFAQALVGDQVLVYNKRAILYRPSADKIIVVGYYSPNSATGTATKSSQIAR